MIHTLNNSGTKKSLECDVCGSTVLWYSFNKCPVNGAHPLPTGWVCFKPITWDDRKVWLFCPEETCQTERRVIETNWKDGIFRSPTRQLRNKEGN